MALELRIIGPGLEVSRRLEAGGPALIVGRDSDCAVCLPDPDRNISRRHLSLWNEGDELHFHVLSVVNGVDLADGERPPGTRGVLQPWQVMKLAAYRLTAVPVTGDTVPAADPWDELDRQATRPADDALDTVAAPLEDDDPFGDWGFETTFGPGAPGGSLRADALQPASDLRAFLAGLGLEQGAQVPLTQGELETIGRIARIAVQALLQAHRSVEEARGRQPGDDSLSLGRGDANPLRLDSPLDVRLRYLFGGQPPAKGFAPPDRALAELAGELLAHLQAAPEATRQAIEGTLGEFDPDALKARLLGSGPRLFESARAWDAFAKDYQARHFDQNGWVRELLDRHFRDAYARAFARAKREGNSRRR